MKEAIHCKLLKPSKRSPYWRIRYQLPGESKQSQKSLKVRDERAAQRLMSEFIIEQERILVGIKPSAKLTETANAGLESLLKSHLQDLRAQHCDADHVLNRELLLRRVGREAGWKSIRSITADSFVSWRARQDLAPRTLNNYLAEVRAFLNWLVMTGNLEANPLARISTVKAHKKVRARRALTDEEIKEFLAAAPKKRRIIYLIALHTGLRRNEIALLQWQDVFIDAPVPSIKLRAATTKNRKGDVVSIHPELQDELRNLRPNLPVPTARVVQMFSGLDPFKKDLAAAGIAFIDESGRRFDFHAMRMTFNTRLANGNVPTRTCMQAMRHSDEKLTTVVYTDASRLNVAAHVASLPNLLGSGLGSPIVSQESEPEGNREPLTDTEASRPIDLDSPQNQDFSHTLTLGGTLLIEWGKSSLTRART